LDLAILSSSFFLDLVFAWADRLRYLRVVVELPVAETEFESSSCEADEQLEVLLGCDCVLSATWSLLRLIGVPAGEGSAVIAFNCCFCMLAYCYLGFLLDCWLVFWQIS